MIQVRDMAMEDLGPASGLSIRVRRDSWKDAESAFYPKDLFEQELELYSPEVLSAYVGKSDRFACVAVDAGRIVGIVLGKCDATTGVADLGWIGVDSSMQRRGIAGDMVEAACTRARNAGCHKMIAYTFALLEGANRMYRAYGFVKEAEMKRHWLRLDFVMYARQLD